MKRSLAVATGLAALVIACQPVTDKAIPVPIIEKSVQNYELPTPKYTDLVALIKSGEGTVMLCYKLDGDSSAKLCSLNLVIYTEHGFVVGQAVGYTYERAGIVERWTDESGDGINGNEKRVK